MLSLLVYHGLDGTHQGVSWVDYRMVTIEGVRSCTLSFPPASAVEGIKSVPSVCLSVRVSVS